MNLYFSNSKGLNIFRWLVHYVCYPADLISGNEDGVSTFQEDEHETERYRREQKDCKRKKTKRENRKRNVNAGQEMELYEKPEKTRKAKRRKENNYGVAGKTRRDVEEKKEEDRKADDCKINEKCGGELSQKAKKKQHNKTIETR